jgi:hypothetical protein
VTATAVLLTPVETVVGRDARSRFDWLGPREGQRLATTLVGGLVGGVALGLWLGWYWFAAGRAG